jgi:3-oxochol-4-en-24-oyl-CoA dehydrogenase
MSPFEGQTNADLELVRDSAADFCTRALGRERLRGRGGNTPSSIDRAIWRQMAELGWAAILIPTELGGLELGSRAASEVCRKLGGVVAPEPMLETAVAAATLLARLNAPSTLLDALIAGDCILSPALGPDNTTAFATLRGEQRGALHVLTGKIDVPLGADLDGWLLPATLNAQPAWYYLASKTANITARLIPLADGSCDTELILTECEATLLGVGEAARAALACARDQVEVASSATLLGLAEALFSLTVDYVGTRRQFGQAIGSFQVIQHRLVDMYLQLRLTEAAVTASHAALERETGAAGTQAARARYRACHTALLIAREAVQLHGAMGYTDECDVVLYLNRIMVLVARYGNAATQVTRLATFGMRSADDALDPKLLQGIDATANPPDWNALGDDVFRATVRTWFETYYPPELRNPRARLHWHECRDWYATLYQRGWAAPGWPTEYGGMGLSADKLLIFMEERERWGVARTPDQGIIMIGPVLIQHGSPAQREYYLPRALSGEHIWCQGYSEPNAGSDLASLRTTAVRDGAEFVINGQKIWTTLAQDATHMFCLARTAPEAKPQAGISFILIDLKVPGITIRPIRNLAGDAEFCEVFLNDVRVPVDSLVGELHDGWTIAKALLGFERIWIGSPKQCHYALKRLVELAAARRLFDDPVFVDRLTRYALDVADLESLYKEFADVVRRGETLGPDVSILKIWASETFSRLSEFIIEAAGAVGARVGDIDFGTAQIDVLSQYYNARPTTIYGGSNEIQRNIVAKQVLKLPSR